MTFEPRKAINPGRHFGINPGFSNRVWRCTKLRHPVPGERQSHLTSQWVMDATFPAHWPREYRARHSVVSDFTHGWSEKMQAKVLASWADYGYASAPTVPRARAAGGS